MPFYIDTSALVKRYRTEPGTEVVEELVSQRRLDEEFYSSYLTAVEIESVARRAVAGKLLRPAARRKLLGRFYEDIRDWLALQDITRETMSRAAGFAGQYGLRAPDAIHLAAASVTEKRLVISSDKELLDACIAEGYDVLNPEGPSALGSLRASAAMLSGIIPHQDSA